MIDCTCTYRNGALHPVGQFNAELLDKARPGVEYRVKVTRARSLPQNALYWSLLNRVCEAVGWHSTEGLHMAIKHALGHLDSFVGLDGRIQLGVGSTAFDKLDADGFRAFFDAAVVVMDEKWQGVASAILRDMEQGK